MNSHLDTTMPYDKILSFCIQITFGFAALCHSTYANPALNQLNPNNGVPIGAIPLPAGTKVVQLHDGTVLIQKQHRDPPQPIPLDQGNKVRHVMLPPGSTVPVGAIPLKKKGGAPAPHSKAVAQAEVSSDSEKPERQYTIPDLPDEVDDVQKVLPEVDLDMSDPTQVIGLKGEEKQVTENSEFVVPTRIIIPHVAGEAVERIDPPVQNVILSADTLNTRDIIPFEPKPDPLDLEDIPACPVNFDEEKPKLNKILGKKFKKKKKKSQPKKEKDEDSAAAEHQNDQSKDSSKDTDGDWDREVDTDSDADKTAEKNKSKDKSDDKSKKKKK